MPGTVYPLDGRPRSTKSRGEVAVYDALRARLPDGWTAWHSLRVRVGTTWEGEGDFVIAAPDRGVLVLEVKSGVVECRGGRWYQNDREVPPPRDQSRGYVRKLAKALEERKVEAPPWGDACVFPDVDFAEGPGAGDLAGRVIGRRDLEWLDRALDGLFDRAVPVRPMAGDRRWLDTLHALWGETWVPPVRLRGRVEEASARTIALNQDQLGLLDFAAQMPHARVEGQAGSGKTLVAIELCRRRAAAGQRALYLCYTEALAHAVEHALAGTGARAVAIQRYACDLLRAAGQQANPRTPAEWRDVSLAAACDALPADEARPDLVVVDEAHDLTAADWDLVQALAAGRGLWVFCDGRQHFWPERTIPEPLLRELPPLTLKQQLRNPPAIAAFASLYTAAPADFDGHVNPDILRLALAPHDQVLDRVRHELMTLQAAGARAEDIAVLTLAGQDKSSLFHRDRLGQHRLVHADAPDAASATIADTFLRFKGLERPFVIVTELVHGERMKVDTRMHIALTRATAGAVVVCSPELAALDERLGRLPQA
jgi:hypothetical protein